MSTRFQLLSSVFTLEIFSLVFPAPSQLFSISAIPSLFFIFLFIWQVNKCTLPLPQGLLTASPPFTYMLKPLFHPAFIFRAMEIVSPYTLSPSWSHRWETENMNRSFKTHRIFRSPEARKFQNKPQGLFIFSLTWEWLLSPTAQLFEFNIMSEALMYSSMELTEILLITEFCSIANIKD